MANAYGRDSWGSLSPEATYGVHSAVAETYFRIIDEGLSMDVPVKPSPSLHGVSPRFTYQGNKDCGGPFKVELLYQGLNQFIRHAMGAYAFAADSPVVGARLHTIGMADALPVGLTVEMCKANMPSGKVFLYTGCKVNAFELAFEPDMPVIMTLDLIAQTETPNTTASGTPTYPAYNPVLWSHAGTLTLAGTASLEIVKGKIRVDNKLKKRFLMHNTTREPLRDVEQRAVTGEFTIEFENLTLYDKFIAPTTGTLALTYTSQGYITGTTPYTMTITAPKIQLEKPTINISGAGIVEATYPFISLHDNLGSAVTNDQLLFVFNNSELTL